MPGQRLHLDADTVAHPRIGVAAIRRRLWPLSRPPLVAARTGKETDAFFPCARLGFVRTICFLFVNYKPELLLHKKLT